MTDVPFFQIWTTSIGKADKINMKAWLGTVPELILMIIICVLDCLLKIAGTETKLPVKIDKDNEIRLFGLGNILTVLSGSSVGYMQLKFNIISFGVMGNVEDRRCGLIYALLCGIFFFSPAILLFNY